MGKICGDDLIIDKMYTFNIQAIVRINIKVLYLI